MCNEFIIREVVNCPGVTVTYIESETLGAAFLRACFSNCDDWDWLLKNTALVEDLGWELCPNAPGCALKIVSGWIAECGERSFSRTLYQEIAQPLIDEVILASLEAASTKRPL